LFALQFTGPYSYYLQTRKVINSLSGTITEEKILISMRNTTSLETSIYHQYKCEDGKSHTIRHYLEAHRTYLVVKRITDIFISLLVILLIFPWLLPVIITLIKLDSRGPIFFKQKRVGFLGRTFWCYKFRTMHLNDSADTRQAIRNDPRVTRAGQFLRNTGVDELPQFINVLLGHMSIVGPRPHMLKDSRDFTEVVANYRFRNLARPGITGMSQVRGCRGPATSFASIFRRYQWDAYYVRNVSFLLDLRIMVETGILIFTSLFNKDKPIPTEPSRDEQSHVVKK
jgi:putative colanic acid biosynthesis UDP-glucose lipid carrier transferase